VSGAARAALGLNCNVINSESIPQCFRACWQSRLANQERESGTVSKSLGLRSGHIPADCFENREKILRIPKRIVRFWRVADFDALIRESSQHLNQHSLLVRRQFSPVLFLRH